jgi:hypothetical protein
VLRLFWKISDFSAINNFKTGSTRIWWNRDVFFCQQKYTLFILNCFTVRIYPIYNKNPGQILPSGKGIGFSLITGLWLMVGKQKLLKGQSFPPRNSSSGFPPSNISPWPMIHTLFAQAAENSPRYSQFHVATGLTTSNNLESLENSAVALTALSHDSAVSLALPSHRLCIHVHGAVNPLGTPIFEKNTVLRFSQVGNRCDLKL